MGRFYFGGIHPASKKGLTRRKPITDISPAPHIVVLPLIFDHATPAQPVVWEGEIVKLGQLLAREGDENSLPVHASVSGRVLAVEKRPHPWLGLAVMSIVIENDGKDTPFEYEICDFHTLSQEQLIQSIRQAGIVGMGGDPYPVHQRVLDARGRVDTLIINAVECEPYLTADHRLLLEQGKRIVRGARILGRVLGAKRTIIASSGDKLNGIERLERMLNKIVPLRPGEQAISVKTIRSCYPLGAEKLIVQSITGREVPSGGSAVDVHCTVFNVATAYAVGQALETGMPLTHRIVTVSGGAVTRPRNLRVPIGTPISDLLVCAGGLKSEPYLTLLGGPMTGMEITDLSVPLLKNIGGVICLGEWEKPPERHPTVCLQCGHCVAACPMNLSPVFIHRAFAENNTQRLASLYPQDCISCGCCDYTCPCHISLMNIMRLATEKLAEEGVVAP